MDQRWLASGQLISIRRGVLLMFRVILIIGIDEETVRAVGGRLGVAEALNQVAGFLGQDIGRILEGRFLEHVGLGAQHDRRDQAHHGQRQPDGGRAHRNSFRVS
jgi:hypothetical protein